MPCNFKPGDLVYFDFLHTIGVVVDTKEITEENYFLKYIMMILSKEKGKKPDKEQS